MGHPSVAEKSRVVVVYRINDNQVMDGAENRFFDKVPMKFADYTHQRFALKVCVVVPPAAVRQGSFIG